MDAYEFDRYRIEAGERLLRRGDDMVPLPPKVADTLLALLRSSGRMVDKSELMNAVWPDTFVEEGALTRNISLLRKALGDGEDGGAFIETIPKRGYRFVPPVRTMLIDRDKAPVPDVAAQHRRMSWRPWISAAVAVVVVAAALALRFVSADGALSRPVALSTTAVAVLPFRALGGDEAQRYMAEGIAQAVITQLAHVRSMRVVSLASHSDATAWQAMSKDTSIEHALSGSVIQSGGRVRVNSQLTNVRTRAVTWANSYDRDVADVLTLASTMAENIAMEVRATITANDRTRMQQHRPRKPESLDPYLRGKYSWNLRTEEGLRRAARYFQQAIGADPSDPLPYAGLADSYALLASLGTDGLPPKEAMPVAKAAAQKAVELGPELADGHVSLGYVKLSYDWDLPGSERAFSRALELNPQSATAHHWYGHYFMAKGDLAKATEHLREALRLEPLSKTINIGVGWCYFYSGNYDRAIEQFRSVTEIDPDLPLARLTLGMAYEQSGNLGAAMTQYARAKQLSANSPLAVTAMATAHARAGRTPDARSELALLQQLSHERYVPAFYFAAVYQALGERRTSAEWGWKAVGERCDYFMYLKVDPRAGPLASRPEFMRILAAIGR